MTTETTTLSTTFDVDLYRQDFPILSVKPYGKPLVFLDNAATSQKPRQVIDAIKTYYESQNSNVHRGLHYLSEIATERFDSARESVRGFLNAASTREVVFTSGNTDALNLVANSYGGKFIGEGDEVLISTMEHHSNIVPWQMLCERVGAKLVVAPIDDNGDIIMDEFASLLTERTKLVSVVYVSNALGTINPVERIIELAHAQDVPVMLDAAQAAPHLPIDVQKLDCDFLTLAPHKMFAPTGIGVLYGKEALLEKMPPYRGGGDMIVSVTFEKTVYNELPFKFEAGTPNIAGVIGLGAAVEYINTIGMDRIAAYENELLEYGTEALNKVDGLTMVGTAKHKAAVFGFTLDSAHPHDIGQIVNDEGVAIRAGHHCAQPVMKRFGLPATARASCAFYNTTDEIDALVVALEKVNQVFG